MAVAPAIGVMSSVLPFVPRSYAPANRIVGAPVPAPGSSPPPPRCANSGQRERGPGSLQAHVALVVPPHVGARHAAGLFVVERIKGGNAKAMGALVGPIMRETRGRADGGEVNRLIREQLGV